MARNKSEKELAEHSCDERRWPGDVCGGCVRLVGGTSMATGSKSELEVAYERLKLKVKASRKRAQAAGEAILHDALKSPWESYGKK